MSITYRDLTILRLQPGPQISPALLNQGRPSMPSLMKRSSASREQKSQDLIFGVDIESFLPELSFGREDPTGCTIGLSFIEHLARTVLTVLGQVRGCSPRVFVLVN